MISVWLARMACVGHIENFKLAMLLDAKNDRSVKL